MVIDTSALLAIFLAEPERQSFLERIRQDGSRLLSAPNALETSIVLEARRGVVAGREFDLFLHRLNIELVPVDAAQIEVARSGWRRYGKGRHPAALNFGDCFAYALSKTSGEPLLAKGNDFPKTDIHCL
ncbi:MAG TPA: type II toxin-antitoxin system VapC family toxin [Candidatus Binatus sp.]|jgi:ribonuclease VapC|nr:type II toxin-antitoxin system VapC family toxin [Candidatus Binatus sp.]